MLFEENKSLKTFHTFHTDVVAKYFAPFTNEESLKELVENLPTKKLLILGGGSNMLFTENFNGTILKNECRGITLIKEDQDHFYIKVAAGENWHSFVLYAIQNGYTGIENLSLIPGNTGASPIQNIGAYGVEIKDLLYDLEAYHLKDQSIVVFTNHDCLFGYRDSVFKSKWAGQFVILSVTFRLRRKPVFHTNYGVIEQELDRMGITELSCKAISDAIIRIRSSKLPDPEVIGNAGSFFKNPSISKAHYDLLKVSFPEIPGYPNKESNIKVAAGWLIEQCGWKGYRKGDVGCFNKQALVLVNYGVATGREIFDLSEEIIRSVQLKFNISLEREVNIF